MTLKEAIDILEKELECRNRLIEDAEYGIEGPCLFDCSACKYNTDSTEARDALSLLLEVVKSKEQQTNEECKDLAKDGYNIEDIKKAQSKLYSKYVEGFKLLEEYYEELIKSVSISGSLATPPTPIPLPNDIPSHPKCMDCCKDDEEEVKDEKE